MKVICVDDEKIILSDMMMMCEHIDIISSAEAFSKASDALEYVTSHPVDAALLDINMPGMNGLELAKAIKEASPKTNIIFTTGYSEYALNAFELHARGYLMKPVTEEMIQKELEELQTTPWENTPSADKEIFIQTFGGFSVYEKGKSIAFSRRRSAEILAYLVDKQGAPVSRKELAAVILDKDDYSRNTQSVLNGYITFLKNDLAEVGAERILKNEKGLLSVDISLFDCDLYEFLRGDIRAVNAYMGEYLSNYSWAEFKNGYLRKQISEM